MIDDNEREEKAEWLWKVWNICSKVFRLILETVLSIVQICSEPLLAGRNGTITENLHGNEEVWASETRWPCNIWSQMSETFGYSLSQHSTLHIRQDSVI